MQWLLLKCKSVSCCNIKDLFCQFDFCLTFEGLIKKTADSNIDPSRVKSHYTTVKNELKIRFWFSNTQICSQTCKSLCSYLKRKFIKDLHSYKITVLGQFDVFLSMSTFPIPTLRD